MQTPTARREKKSSLHHWNTRGPHSTAAKALLALPDADFTLILMQKHIVSFPLLVSESSCLLVGSETKLHILSKHTAFKNHGTGQ